MDGWIAVNTAKADRMMAVMRAFGFDAPELKTELFLKEPSIVRMGLPPMRIVVCTGISGVTFDECSDTRIIDTMDGVEVSVIALDKLKRNKKASGRFKDLDDLEHLP